MARRAASRLTFLAVAGLIALMLSGCSSAPFETPIVWSTGPESADEGSDASTVRVQLDDDGVARVDNMPTGTSRRQGETDCLVTSGDTYSGPATWERDGDYRVRLSFGGSEVVINSDVTFGQPAWYDVQFSECGPGPHRSWWMPVECGVTSPNADPKYTTPCRNAEPFGDADAVGVWRSMTPGVVGVITIRSDGKFEIANWPTHVNCVKPFATEVAQLTPTDVEDVAGSWSLASDENAPGPLLLFSECTWSLAPAISRGEDGHLEMTIGLPSGASVTDSDRALVFRKD